MERPHTYQITVQGRLDREWSGWFCGMVITYQTRWDGQPITMLTGAVVDQAALYGMLSMIRGLNLHLVS
ncbi:MAG TPA: hypothetical protein VLY63_00435, partial [Anaerolineae bacterium]|nr:hypothetical protein [Anaerolineae bacterium]